MDHLPLPHGRTRYPYDFPLLCTTHYDNETFGEYPFRCGWDLNDLQNGKFENIPAGQELAPFLQSWLYFGLLADVLGTTIDFNDFRDESGFLSTKRLPRLIEDWKARIYLLEDETRSREQYRVYTSLSQSAIVGRWLTRLEDEPPVPGPIVLSMQVLVSTLYTAAVWIWRQEVTGMGATVSAWVSSRLVLLEMVRDGWCPAMLDRWTSRTSTPALAYIRELGRPDRSDHTGCGPDSDRPGWNKCAGRPVEVGTYQTKHTIEGCDCDFLGVDEQAVAGIVYAGGVPVLTLVDDEIAVSYDETGEYVAISHVWRDGLGNVGHNSLPTCQLRIIDARVREAGGQGFWIDTICVPAQRELKARALKGMAKVYRDAKIVLVFDAYLRRSSCKNSDLENHLRISISGWMERLWTFQEASLAPEGRLRVAFADGIIPLDFWTLQQTTDSHRLAATWEDARQYVISNVHMAELSLLRTFDNPAVILADWPVRMKTIWLCAKNRLVTEPGDEFIVFATLFGMDSESLYILDTDQRMEALLNMHGEWAQEFLFASGPRLRTPGYQWAPASFIHCSMGFTDNQGVYLTGTRTPNGLIVQRQSFTFLETKAELMAQTFLCQDHQSAKWYRFMFRTANNPPDSPSWDTLSPIKGRKTGVLVGPHSDADGTNWALLVTIEKEEEGIIYATFGCRITMVCIESDANTVYWSNALAPWNRPEESKAQELKLWPEKDCWEVFGRIDECIASQKWCIG